MVSDRSSLHAFAATHVVIALSIALAFAIQATAYLNHDVAFLAWVADQMGGHKVFGRDIYEANPPLSFLIYSPAMVGRVLGIDLAVKIWICVIAAASLSLSRLALSASVRFPVIVVAGLFFALALPREFGQREQIAMLLCMPYAAGSLADRRLAIISGIMAGIGFAIKPYFLIPLGLLVLSRRRIRTEEFAIAATGMVYAIILVLFFRPYLFEMLPAARSVYWALSAVNPVPAIIAVVGIVAAFALRLKIREVEAPGLLWAALGFAIGVGLQDKFYNYHLLPVWGFLALFLAAQLVTPQARVLAAGIGAIVAIGVAGPTYEWFVDTEHRNSDIPRLLRAIDASESYTVIAVHPYPAFPTTIYASKPYLGLSNSHWFLPAAAKIATGQEQRPMGRIDALAIDQAVRELRQSPDLVIVDPDWRRHTGLTSATFDGLEWLNSDRAFRALWDNYHLSGKAGRFLLFRRRHATPLASPAG